MAKLPNGDKATVDIEKLLSYALKPDHRNQKGQLTGKARLWESMLGVTKENAEWLVERLLEAARDEEATEKRADAFGQRYEIKFPLTGLNGETKIVMAAWIIDAGEENPRLTTTFPEADE